MPKRLAAIPSLSNFHARYLEIVREIGFVDGMIDRVRERVDCMVGFGGVSGLALVACSLAVNCGEGYVAAWLSCYCNTCCRIADITST